MTKKKIRREISAGLIVVRRAREGWKFLLLYHGRNYWNFPKGEIESEEKALDAAVRETKEETGLKKSDLTAYRNFKVYQKIFLPKKSGPVFKIVILYLAETRNPRIVISYEHQGYGWFLYPEALRISKRHPGVQKTIKQAYDFIRGKDVATKDSDRQKKE